MYIIFDISIKIYLHLCVFESIAIYIYISIYIYLNLSMSIYIYLSLSLSFYIYRFIFIYLYQPKSSYISFNLYIYIYNLSFFILTCLYLSIPSCGAPFGERFQYHKTSRTPAPAWGVDAPVGFASWRALAMCGAIQRAGECQCCIPPSWEAYSKLR